MKKKRLEVLVMWALFAGAILAINTMPYNTETDFAIGLSRLMAQFGNVILFFVSVAFAWLYISMRPKGEA